MKKNTATKWLVFAFDRTDNTPKTGDALNITADVYIDGVVNAVDDTNPTELASGYYLFDITAAETNGDHIMINPVSTTTNIQVIGVPGAAWTDTLAADLATVDGIVDSILEDTGTTLDGKIDTIDTNVDSILDDTGTSGVLLAATADSAALVDSIWDEVLTAATHNVATSAGRRLRGASTDAVGGTVVVGTTPTTTVFDTDLTAGDDVYNDQLIVFTSGAAAGQARVVQDYVNISGVITVSEPFTAAPGNGDAFEIHPAHIHTVADIVDAVWDELLAGHVTADTFGDAINTLDSTPAPTAAAVADAVWDEAFAGHVAAGSFGYLFGVDWDATLDAILADTAELQGDWVDGGRLDALIDAILLDTGTTLQSLLTTVDGKVDNILTDTGTTLDAAIAAMQADVTAILADSDELQSEWADGGRLDLILDTAAATNPTAADIADAVWDELLSGHVVAGSAGEALAAAGTAGDPWITTLPGSYTGSQAGKIISDLLTNLSAVLVDTGTTLDGKLDAIDAVVDAILVDTGTTLDGKLDTIDTNVDSILEDTGTTIPAVLGTPADTDLATDIANMQADVSALGAPPTAAAIADAVWDEASGDHVTADTFGGDLSTALAGLTSSVAGLGAVANTITVTVSGVPLAGVDVWVTSDQAGTTVVAGTLQTDGNGEVVFYLDPGTYYVWQQKTGYNFEIPDTLVVT